MSWWTMLCRGCKCPAPLSVNSLLDKLHDVLPRLRKSSRLACFLVSFLQCSLWCDFFVRPHCFVVECMVQWVDAWYLPPCKTLRSSQVRTHHLSGCARFSTCDQTRFERVFWISWTFIMPLLFLWACTPTSNYYNNQQVRENACLETRQLSHGWFRCMILGSPVAIFFSPIILSVWKFTCLSLACHSQAGSASAVNREVMRPFYLHQQGSISVDHLDKRVS